MFGTGRADDKTIKKTRLFLCTLTTSKRLEVYFFKVSSDPQLKWAQMALNSDIRLLLQYMYYMYRNNTGNLSTPIHTYRDLYSSPRTRGWPAQLTIPTCCPFAIIGLTESPMWMPRYSSANTQIFPLVIKGQRPVIWLVLRWSFDYVVWCKNFK